MGGDGGASASVLSESESHTLSAGGAGMGGGLGLVPDSWGTRIARACPAVRPCRHERIITYTLFTCLWAFLHIHKDYAVLIDIRTWGRKSVGKSVARQTVTDKTAQFLSARVGRV